MDSSYIFNTKLIVTHFLLLLDLKNSRNVTNQHQQEDNEKGYDEEGTTHVYYDLPLRLERFDQNRNSLKQNVYVYLGNDSLNAQKIQEIDSNSNLVNGTTAKIKTRKMAVVSATQDDPFADAPKWETPPNIFLQTKETIFKRNITAGQSNYKPKNNERTKNKMVNTTRRIAKIDLNSEVNFKKQLNLNINRKLKSENKCIHDQVQKPKLSETTYLKSTKVVEIYPPKNKFLSEKTLVSSAVEQTSLSTILPKLSSKINNDEDCDKSKSTSTSSNSNSLLGSVESCFPSQMSKPDLTSRSEKLSSSVSLTERVNQLLQDMNSTALYTWDSSLINNYDAKLKQIKIMEVYPLINRSSESSTSNPFSISTSTLNNKFSPSSLNVLPSKDNDIDLLDDTSSISVFDPKNFSFSSSSTSEKPFSLNSIKENSILQTTEKLSQPLSSSVSERVKQIRQERNLSETITSLVNNQNTSSSRFKQMDIMRLTTDFDDFDYEDEFESYVEDEPTDNVSSIKSDISTHNHSKSIDKISMLPDAESAFVEKKYAIDGLPESRKDLTIQEAVENEEVSHEKTSQYIDLISEFLFDRLESIQLTAFTDFNEGRNITIYSTEKLLPYRKFLFDLCKDIIKTEFRTQNEGPIEKLSIYQIARLIGRSKVHNNQEDFKSELKKRALKKVYQNVNKSPSVLDVRHVGVLGFWQRKKRRDFVDSILYEEVVAEDPEWNHFEEYEY